MASQNERVLNYMREHGSIDPMRAVRDLGIYRLSARIYDLKALGVAIKSEPRFRRDEAGKIETKWEEYRLA